MGNKRYTIETIDDRLFGHDKSHPLESIGGYTWIGQIDSTDAGKGRAPGQFKDAVWDIFRGIPKQIGGSSLVPVLTSFEERLRDELEASPGCLTVGLEDFRDDVIADLENEILGFKSEGDSDAAFLVNVYGNLVRYFRYDDKKGIDGLRMAGLIADIPSTPYEWTLSAMSVSTIQMAALAEIGEIRLTEERKSSILADISRTADKVLSGGNAREEFVRRFAETATVALSGAPTVPPPAARGNRLPSLSV